MSGVVRLSIIDPNEATRNELKNMLIGVDMVWLEAECSRYEFFTEVVSQTQPDIALISLVRIRNWLKPDCPGHARFTKL